VIGQRAQRIVEAAHQRPAKTLRLHGIAKRDLRVAEPAPWGFQLQKQHAALAEHHQICKAAMDAHADQDRLTRRPARAGLGNLVGAVMKDCPFWQGEAQGTDHRALQIRLGRATPGHDVTSGSSSASGR
jgi:hypothetical protein